MAFTASQERIAHRFELDASFSQSYQGLNSMCSHFQSPFNLVKSLADSPASSLRPSAKLAMGRGETWRKGRGTCVDDDGVGSSLCRERSFQFER